MGEASVAEAQEALDRDYAPIEDMRAGAAYRRLIARNLLRKFYLENSGYTGETRVLARGR